MEELTEQMENNTEITEKKYEPRFCYICNKIIRSKQNYRRHCRTPAHISKEEMYKSLQIETPKETPLTKRKLPELPEEYSKALNLYKSLKVKDTNPALIG